MFGQLKSTLVTVYGWISIVAAALLSGIAAGLEVAGMQGVDLLAILLGTSALVLFAMGWRLLSEGPAVGLAIAPNKRTFPVNRVQLIKTTLLEQSCLKL